MPEISVTEAAKRAKVQRSTVLNWINAQYFKARFLVSKWWIDEESFSAWLNENTKTNV